MNLPTIDLAAARKAPSSPPVPLLRVSGLAINFGGLKTPMGAVDDATFDVARGETVCLVGESGCGKTVTALSLLRLEPYRHGRIAAGEIVFDGRGLVELGSAASQQPGTAGGGAVERPTTRDELWIPILLIVLIGLCIEWAVYHRDALIRMRRGLGARFGRNAPDGGA